MTQNGVNTPVSSGGSSAGSIPIPTSGEVRLMVRKRVKRVISNAWSTFCCCSDCVLLKTFYLLSIVRAGLYKKHVTDIMTHSFTFILIFACECIEKGHKIGQFCVHVFVPIFLSHLHNNVLILFYIQSMVKLESFMLPVIIFTIQTSLY